MKEFWRGKKVLVTGHTGFKGSWLSLWLQKLGAKVIGYSLLPPTEYNMFNIAKVEDCMISLIGDIREAGKLKHVMLDYQPEVVFHLAAQALVRKSYEQPIDNFSTNLMGTVNVLDIARQVESIRVVVNVTSDKCYENKEWVWGYRENDPMGGFDPYSCSKGCAELITSCYWNSYFKSLGKGLASARAGNVVGGGDWAKDRLIPDIVRCIMKKEPIIIRNPQSIRPWQHVLEPLSGYLLLAERLWEEPNKYSQGWNFGPEDKQSICVFNLTKMIIDYWDVDISFEYDTRINPHEANYLKLDCSKANRELGWYPNSSLQETIKWTVEWYKAYINQQQDMQDLTIQQVTQYEEMREEKR